MLHFDTNQHVLVHIFVPLPQTKLAAAGSVVEPMDTPEVLLEKVRAPVQPCSSRKQVL